METNIRLPHDFYEQLFNTIDNWVFIPRDEDDTICPIEIEIGNFTVSLDAEYQVEVVDDSFDHEFGTEYLSHYEAEELLNIDDVVIYYNDEDAEDVNVSYLFSYDAFWNQFKKYGTIKNGVQIHHGDVVVAKCSNNFGQWEKVIYLYTDNRLGVYVCAESLSRNSIKKHYHLLLPANTGALSIVGEVDYRFRDKA